MYNLKYAEMYNVEYVNMRCKVQCRVCIDVAIPDGISLHLWMEILSLTTHLVQLHKKQYFEAVFWYSNAPAWYCGILIFWPRILVFWLLRPDTKVAFLSAVAPPAVDCMTWEVAFGKLIPYLFKTDSAASAWEENLRGKSRRWTAIVVGVGVEEIQISSSEKLVAT